MMQHIWDTQGYYAADAGRAGFGPRLSGSGIRALLEMPWLKTIQSEVPLSDEWPVASMMSSSVLGPRLRFDFTPTAITFDMMWGS